MQIFKFYCALDMRFKFGTLAFFLRNVILAHSNILSHLIAKQFQCENWEDVLGLMAQTSENWRWLKTPFEYLCNAMNKFQFRTLSFRTQMRERVRFVYWGNSWNSVSNFALDYLTQFVVCAKNWNTIRPKSIIKLHLMINSN